MLVLTRYTKVPEKNRYSQATAVLSDVARNFKRRESAKAIKKSGIFLKGIVEWVRGEGEEHGAMPLMNTPLAVINERGLLAAEDRGAWKFPLELMPLRRE